MSKKTFLISLKPLEDYFFGGELTFGEQRAIQDYFVKSNYYPQQTGLLGLLRYILLAQNDCLPLHNHGKKGETLIGANSFSFAENHQFGLIDSISPLMIKQCNNLYRFAHPLSNLEIDFQAGQCFTDSKKAKIPILKDYDPKLHYDAFVTDADGKNVYHFSDVFEEHTRIGIQKNDPDKTAHENRNSERNEDAFVKQTFCTLKNNFAFAFFASLKTEYQHEGKDYSFNLQNCTESFGGEQKQFQISIAEAETGYDTLFNNKNDAGNKITLLSDAYLPNTILSKCNFALIETQDFRTVKQKYHKSKFDREKVKLSLLKRGSVLYFKEAITKSELEEASDFHQAFQRIGYNHYKIGTI